jgi:hypothetical protein
MKELNHISGFREELLKEPYVQGLHMIIDALNKQVAIQEQKIEELTHTNFS